MELQFRSSKCPLNRLSASCTRAEVPFRYLSPNARKKRCLRRYRNLLRAVQMVTTFVYLHMARRDLESLLRWKEDR
jgi:hypothetical protein